ncbi:TetR/AcrR family transcriptional regulator [Bremerella sp. P1]|uniref:TetR/AcrR family transcriptional regulator n=1 Tax=Bremerella sp. P1 TaxID=3026424 RepID=UPI002367CAD8|nr:TetR/AcrR family transcriptional regulator [Bremerella sp. P1]WDI40189.1 TetR/AcrR family transcriptional regulator [Bremerella sp. P1]
MTKPTSHEPEKAKPGRPPVYTEKERCQRLLTAAEQVFTTTGYGAATMEEIAKSAGMSKKTLYALYPDKEHLFAAMVGGLWDSPWENDQSQVIDAGAELRRRLHAMVQFIMTARQVRLTRLLISEAERTPKLARDFHDRVISKARRYLAEAVERARDEGVGPQIDDVDQMTATLLGAALARNHLGALFGRKPKATKKQLEDQVDTALRLLGY